MTPPLLERVKTCTDLPSLPAIAVQVLEMTQAAEADLGAIAAAISRDPALSGKILRTVNSSFYGRARNVGTMSQAMVVLGLQSVKTLVLGFSLVSNLAPTKAKTFRHVRYWKHSLFTATAARLIAARVGVMQVEEIFLSALLADIGMLVFDRVIPEDYGAVAGTASHASLAEAEQAAFGATHAQVSGLLVEQWKLPPMLSTPIAHHHDPALVADAALRRMAEIIHMASRCADVFVDDDASPAIKDLRETHFKAFGLDAGAGDTLLGQIEAKTRETAKLFEINIGDSEPYETILARANEALVQLMLLAQHQTDTLRQQNETLRHQAMTDRLTGLANRTAFEQRSSAMWEHAVATGRPLSLVMIDLDKFKSINDTYGHPAGDEVLRVVGRILAGLARPQDVVARFGGEEMVLVLPDTPRPAAVALAETVRLSVRAKAVLCHTTPVPVTASLGVASIEPGSPLKTLAHVIKAADLALYQAKHTGRDRVKVFQPNVAKAA